MADVTILEDGTEVCLPLPESWSDAGDSEVASCPSEPAACAAGVTILDDGTEVCLPLPENWSDSDDSEVASCPSEPAPCVAAVVVSRGAGAIAGASAFSPPPRAPYDAASLERLSTPQLRELRQVLDAVLALRADAEPLAVARTAAAPLSGLALIATIPAHNHAERALAEAGEGAAALARLASLEPLPEQSCELLQAGSTGPEAFAARFAAGPGRPCVVRGVPDAEGWPAAQKWRTQAAFLGHYGHVSVQVTEMGSVMGLGKPFRVELTLREYADYARSNAVDWPFYVWERNFHGERQGLLEDFRAPEVLQDDLYDVSPEIREFLPLTCHLFVLVGGRRTGSNMHRDPKWSSAWNTLLCGCKRWVMFPRDTPAERIGALAGDAYKDGGPQAYWWLDHYPRLRAEGAALGMVDILQRPGDTVFVPSGWWHATLNLPSEGEDVTIACTRNVVPPCTLPWVLPRIRDSDPAFARAFVAALRAKRSDARSILLAAGEPEVEDAALRPRQVGTCESWMLHRRSAETLSLAECRREFVRRGRPLIIEGLAEHLVSAESCGLSRDWLCTHFGEKCVAAYRNFRAPECRAGEQDRAEVMRLREALALLRDGGSGADGLYVYDLSLPLQLPGLLDHVFLPRYFAHCYLQQTMRRHCFSRSWPTLFIGAKGSQSKLHVDQWHSHFWMHLVSGRKRWIIFHPEDAPLLSPWVPEGRCHPTFPDLAALEASGGDALASARRIEVDLEEGDTLFVPGGSPHLVVNLTDTVAVAGNFLDDSNYEAAIADIRAMAAREAPGGAMAALEAALEEIDFDADRGMHDESLPPRLMAVRYRDFAGGAAASWGPVPPNEELDA